MKITKKGDSIKVESDTVNESCKSKELEKKNTSVSEEAKKRAIAFKDKMNELDDCLYESVRDELSNNLDLHRFSALLD